MIRSHCRVVAVLVLTVGVARGSLAQATMRADAWIGVAVSNDPGPIRIVDVFPGSPAELAGLRVGDTLLTIRNVPVSRASLAEILGRLSPGDTLDVLVGQHRRRILRIAATVRPPLEGAGVSIFEIQLDSVRWYARNYLDVARGHMTIIASSGVQIEQSDTSLVLRNEKQGTRIRLDSLLARSAGMRDGETRRDSAAGANVDVLKAPNAVVWGMVVIFVPSRALQSIAGSATTTGLLVARVEPGSRASRTGLQALDVITEVDGHEVATVDQLRVALEGKPGVRHRITLRRDGRKLDLFS